MRELGYTPNKIRMMMDACDDAVIDTAASTCGVSIPAFASTVEGDGDSIFQRIVKWLTSDEGKAFISFLIQLLIMVI